MTTYTTGEYSGKWMRPHSENVAGMGRGGSTLEIEIVGNEVTLVYAMDDGAQLSSLLTVPLDVWDRFRYAIIHDQWEESPDQGEAS